MWKKKEKVETDLSVGSTPVELLSGKLVLKPGVQEVWARVSAKELTSMLSVPRKAVRSAKELAGSVQRSWQ